MLLGFGASTLALVGGWLLLSPLDGSTDSDVRPAAASTALPAAADQACPDGWFCLYEHPNFNRQTAGRMLKFRDGYWQPLRDHSFEEQTSSVQNRLTRESCLSAGWPADGRTIAVPAGADRPTLSGWEDRASGLKAGPCRSRGGEPTASSSQQFRASAQQPR